MKSTVAICLLTVFVCVAQAQNESDGESKVDAKTSPVAITIAKNDAEGNIVENPEYITPKDRPLFCYIDLVNPKPTLIVIKVVNKKVKGLRPNSKFVTLRYRTKKEDGGASFTLKPRGDWPTGTYLINVFLDGKKVDSKEFVVAKKVKTS